MKFNTKTILSITILLLCGICADGYAKSHKTSKEIHKKEKAAAKKAKHVAEENQHAAQKKANEFAAAT